MASSGANGGETITGVRTVADTGSPRQVTIYTDGACSGNPGPGGYGVVMLYGRHRLELSGGFRLTTNNRMEITAAIVALEALKSPCQVTLHSDSQYLVNAMSQGWVLRWKANGWRRTRTERAANIDLWQHLLELCDLHEVNFIWVRGHAGQTENERCDELSVRAMHNHNLERDEGYERGQLPLVDPVG